jgi:hypothetical protein
MSIKPVESFEEAAQRFPGIEQRNAKAIGRFVFFAAKNFSDEFYESARASRYDFSPDREAGDTWQQAVLELLDTVDKWRQTSEAKVSRYDLAKREDEVVQHKEEQQDLLERIKVLSHNDALIAIELFLHKWQFGVEIKLSKSAMIPEGRTIVKPIDEYLDSENNKCDLPYKSDIRRQSKHGDYFDYADEELVEYLSRIYVSKQAKERVYQQLEAVEGIDAVELSELRSKFGAKVANLMVFDEALKRLYQNNNEDIVKLEIPEYFGVDVKMYELWLHNKVAFDVALEEVRIKAALLAFSAVGGLVAIRSSAVYSEDGENLTGAGVYHSVVADPYDKEAFASAVEAVYASTEAPYAQAYRESAGIADERMGLLVQEYVEQNSSDWGESDYGYVNSRGANTNVTEVHTTKGTLLFDKQKLLQGLLMSGWYSDIDSCLHSTPDHSKPLRRMVRGATEPLHAVLFAEKVFGKAMQIEYAVGSKIVQVRPLPSQSFDQSKAVVFPKSSSELERTKAIGVGDYVLDELSQNGDNSDKTGFVIFQSEYAFTDTFRNADSSANSLPSQGAVIILNHSDSGHIQTLCLEKGLLCFYADSQGEKLETIESLLFEKYAYFDNPDDNTLDKYQSYETTPRQLPTKLRFVADGYEGRIYTV